MGLAHQPAHGLGDPQTSFSMDGEGHGSYYTSAENLPGRREAYVSLVGENPTL